MPYVNGPMILAHRIICEQTGKKSFCQRADELAAHDPRGLPPLLDGPAVRLLVRADDARVRPDGQQRRTGTGSCSGTRAARCTGRATATASTCAPGTGRRRRGRTPRRAASSCTRPTRRCSPGWRRSAARACSGLRAGAGGQQRDERQGDPEDRADRVGEDEPSRPGFDRSPDDRSTCPCQPLFLGPTGLADGLAPKECATDSDSPSEPTLQLVPPLAPRRAIRQVQLRTTYPVRYGE